jgi:enamine deaminase RidA (YjgF/YER057c/UK114 family)
MASEAGVDERARTSVAGGELVLLTWTDASGTLAPERAAEEAYVAIDEACRARGVVPLQERVFGDLAAIPAVARGRARVLGGAEEWAVPPTCIEGSPAGRPGLAGVHVVAARGRGHLVREGETVFGRVVEGGAARLLGLSDVGRRGAGRLAPGPAEDAAAAIDAASELLAREGFGFGDVARTWFYLRDILDWYGPFNAVRNAAFRRMRLMGPGGDGRIPASTGIEGRNARGGWCALDLLAVQPHPGSGAGMRRLHNRKQNEATEYGSAFARAMEVPLGDARYLFVSGTASIDDHGSTVHAGDFEAQVRFTLEAVEALLEGAGAGLGDVAQATAFLKNPCDARSFSRLVARSGLAGVPLVTTVADVCRGDLLFEIDATAVVPLRERRPRGGRSRRS